MARRGHVARPFGDDPHRRAATRRGRVAARYLIRCAGAHCAHPILRTAPISSRYDTSEAYMMPDQARARPDAPLAPRESSMPSLMRTLTRSRSARRSALGEALDLDLPWDQVCAAAASRRRAAATPSTLGPPRCLITGVGSAGQPRRQLAAGPRRRWGVPW